MATILPFPSLPERQAMKPVPVRQAPKPTPFIIKPRSPFDGDAA